MIVSQAPPNIDYLFKDKAFIFIDNLVSVIEKAKKKLNDNWSDCFVNKRYFYTSTVGVYNKILKYGAQDCIIFCDKNMEDVRGDSFLIELREKFGDDITLVLHTAHPDHNSKTQLDRYDIYYEDKFDFNLLLTQIRDDLTAYEETASLEEMFYRPPIYGRSFDRGKNEFSHAPPTEIVDDISNSKTMILEATVSHLNKKAGILELAIKNPSNKKETINKRFPLSLFKNVENIVINQIFQIIQTSNSDGINIKFEDTREIELPPKTASLWDEKTINNFDDIETL